MVQVKKQTKYQIKRYIKQNLSKITIQQLSKKRENIMDQTIIRVGYILERVKFLKSKVKIYKLNLVKPLIET